MKVYIGNWPKNPAKERKVDIRIDKWDTWSMDNTLTLIIEPMLKQLKETQNGHPCLGEHADCKGCSCEKDWNVILDKMIFAFHSLNNDWESQYHTGEIDWVHVPIDKDGNEVPREQAEYFRMDKGPNDTHEFDVEGWKNHDARIQEGLELFGKYFRSLWT
jgi:mRNA-degrading endonuclease YafQ of YafQ-DinJ toxin-antitoxin module